MPALCNRQIFWPKGKKIYIVYYKFFLYFLWFFMIVWVILGGFHSWTFFDLSLCFWVTGQIICKTHILCDFDPICIYLSIDFCENLYKYFFVWNQFLIIKTIRKNAKILYKFNVLAFFFILLVWVQTSAKKLNLQNSVAFFLIVLWLKSDFKQKGIHDNFHKNW